MNNGSSPLARGTLRAQRYAVRIRRFIPACAGNSLPDMKVVPPLSVHPRLRGELACYVCNRRHKIGSSPLARGTQLREAITTLCSRFIPACAGNSSKVSAKKLRITVHPRLRGELILNVHPDQKMDGSSPLARGTPLCPGSSITSNRFIPACAGNSVERKASLAMAPVHPRLRGELGGKVTNNGTALGSSPLARGTLGMNCSIRVISRFIPACAGNSATSI